MDDESTGSETVVVPAITAPSSVACVRSLGRRGVRTVVTYEDPQTPCTRSKYCDETVRVAPPVDDTEGYRETLESLARREDVRTIIPVREEDVYVLSKYRDAFAPHVGTVWPEFETLRNVQDRVRLFDIARSAGVPIPETRPLDEWDDWDREAIIKSRYTLLAEEYVGSVAGVATGRGTTQYVPPGETPDLEAIRERMRHVPIAQDYVPGTDEYGFFALYDHGEAVATFQHRQRRGYKYCGGPSAFRESVSIPDLEREGLKLLDALDWHGLAMVEFLRDETTGEFKLMEINPRFWSSLPFTVQAGVDFPAMYWEMAGAGTGTGTAEVPSGQTGRSKRQADGGRDAADPGYRVGIGGHLLKGELLYLHSVFREDYPLVERPSRVGAIRDVLSSLVAHRRFDYLDFDDPMPFVRDAANLAGGLFESSASDGDEDASVPTPTDHADATGAVEK